jgi:plasmid stabilization system protein ParE
MTFYVVLLRLAVQDLDEAYRWAANRAPQTAERWLNRFHQALESLAENPDRCPRAREKLKVDVDLREFLFGRRPNVFRVIFAVRGDAVRVLRIRRAQSRLLSRKDIEQADDPAQ